MIIPGAWGDRIQFSKLSAMLVGTCKPQNCLQVKENITIYNHHNSGQYPSFCFYLKHIVMESGIYLRIQVEPTQLNPD
jgi:hypothetical protein